MTQDIGPEEQQSTEVVAAPVDAPEEPISDSEEPVEEAEEERRGSEWRRAVRALIILIVIILILLLCRCGSGGLTGGTEGGGSGGKNGGLPGLGAEQATDTGVAFEEDPLVPDVVGMSRSAAIAEIEAAGFNASITNVYGTSVPDNTVYQQHPIGGSALEQGGTVGLLVQSRNKATVPAPDVRGLKQAEAERRIRALGLMVTLSYAPDNSRRKVGTVLSQWPLPGRGVLEGGDMQIQIVVKP